MESDIELDKKSKKYGFVLFLLTGIFCFRVLAQLIQVWYPLSFLPSFTDWHSGALPYWLLVIFQFLIIMFCVRVSWLLFQGKLIPSAGKGRVLLFFGAIYFGIMAVRLIVGLTVASNHFWFGAKLPTLFHLILATFLLVYGYYHFQGESKRPPIHNEGTI